MKEKLQEMELRAGKKQIVLCMANSGHKKPWSVMEISRMTGLDKSTVSINLKELNGLGIVKYNELEGTIMQGKLKKNIELNNNVIQIKKEFDIKDDIFIELMPAIPAFIVSYIISAIFPIIDILSVFVSVIIFTFFLFLHIIYRILKSNINKKVIVKVKKKPEKDMFDSQTYRVVEQNNNV